jgi:hypothetical protein
LAIRDAPEKLAHIRSHFFVHIEHRQGCAVSALFGRRWPAEIAPGHFAGRHEAALPHIRSGIADPLAKPADFLLGNGAEHIGDQVGDFSALVNGMHRDAEGLQLLPRAHSLQQASAEPIEPGYDDDQRCALTPEGADVDEEPLIGRAIVAFARKNVLVFGPERPAVVGRVLAAVGELGIERHALAGLVFGADSGIDECDDDAGLLL